MQGRAGKLGLGNSHCLSQDLELAFSLGQMKGMGKAYSTAVAKIKKEEFTPRA